MSEGELIARKGRFTAHLIPDPDPPNPCEDYDQAGTMVCWHSRYNLGHTGGTRRDGSDYSKEYAGMFDTPADFREWWRENGKGGVILPLALYDHSGLTMWVGSGPSPFDQQGWDSGQVGYVFITREKILEEWGKPGGRVTAKMRELAEKLLRAEVKCYDQYLIGDVYGYVVQEHKSDDEDEQEDGEEVDSCWGFFGRDYAEGEALEALACQAEEAATNDEWVKI